MAGQGDADHEWVLQQSCLVLPLANRLLPTATMGNVAAGAAGSWCLASPALVAKLPNLPHASLGGISHGQRSCSQLCLLCMRAEGMLVTLHVWRQNRRGPSPLLLPRAGLLMT